MAQEIKEKTKSAIDNKTVMLGIGMALIIALGVNFATNGQEEDSDSDAKPEASQTEATNNNEAQSVIEDTPEEAKTNTVVDIAVNNDFNTLVAAVTAADLVETLSGEGPFTVFAPTDEAFAALPEGTLESLLLEENKQKLTDILTYHVVAGELKAADVIAANGQNVDTVLGQEWHVLVENGEVFIANPITAEKIAKVLKTDVIGDNGVVHVIDSVLLPQ